MVQEMPDLTSKTGSRGVAPSQVGRPRLVAFNRNTPTGLGWILWVLHLVSHQKLMRQTAVRTTMRYGDAFASDMAEAHGKVVGGR